LLNPYRFGAAAPTDPNFANVSLLLHGNADGSGNIVDSSLSPKTVSKFGNAASATPPAYPNSNSAFSSAIAFDGTNDYLTANNSDLALGTNDFTIEFWVRRSVSTSRAEVVIDYRTAEPQSNIHVYLNPDSGGIYTARVYVNGADRITGTTTLAVNTWYHLAVSRASGQVRLFINGVQNGSAYLDSSNYSSSSLAICGRFAQFGGSYLSPNGFIDELRITKGIARYTANFTPPTAPFPDS
jgi:hypothetical protein